jgi:hypothetical protein
MAPFSGLRIQETIYSIFQQPAPSYDSEFQGGEDRFIAPPRSGPLPTDRNTQTHRRCTHPDVVLPPSLPSPPPWHGRGRTASGATARGRRRAGHWHRSRCGNALDSLDLVQLYEAGWWGVGSGEWAVKGMWNGHLRICSSCTRPKSSYQRCDMCAGHSFSSPILRTGSTLSWNTSVRANGNRCRAGCARERSGLGLSSSDPSLLRRTVRNPKSTDCSPDTRVAPQTGGEGG